MPLVPTHHGGVSILVLVLTAGFVLLGNFASGILNQFEPFLVLGLMLLIGLPHGATDHGLFLALTNKHSLARKVNFYLLYAVVIGMYGLLWYLFPLVAFAIFILLSVYHFGQSNWADIAYGNGNLARFHYLLWGCGILLTPILLHVQEAAFIVEAMTGDLLVPPSETALLKFIGVMALVNAVFMVVCWFKSIVGTRRLFKELLGYSLLLLMFFTNSLLLGFTVYFVFWHSLASAQDQFHFFQSRLSSTIRRELYWGIIATVSGALIFCLVMWFGPGPSAALRPEIIGGVFVFISLLTLPHMILVEALYDQWSPVEEKNIEKPSSTQSERLIHTINLNKEANQLLS